MRELKPGDRCVRLRRIGREEVDSFNSLVGDDNPIHRDARAAKVAGFDGPIAHGMVAGSLFSEILGNELPGPGSIYLQQTFKFLAPIYIPSEVELCVEVVGIRSDQKIVTVRTTCVDGNGKLCLDGEAVLLRRPATQDARKNSEAKSPDFRLIELPNVSDPRGNLSLGEFGHHIPFEVKRYFIVYQVPLVEVRGEHAHRQCHQFLVCVRGRMEVVADDGFRREEFVLDRPNIGLYMPPMTWGAQHKYSPDAVLLVFASHYYDASDYIRGYEEFASMVGAGK